MGIIDAGGTLNLPKINMAALSSGVIIFFSILAILAVIGFLIWLVYRVLSHNIHVIVFDANRRIIRDRAKVITEDGIKKIKLLKLKDKIKPIERKYFFLDGRADTLVFFKPIEGDLIPQSVVHNSPPEFATIPHDIRFWAQQERMSKFKKYMMKSKGLMQYLPVIGLILVITLVSVIFIISVSKYEQLANAMSQTAGSINNYADAVRTMGCSAVKTAGVAP